MYRLGSGWDNRIALGHPEARVALGAIAKGYAVDEAARILRENGVERFLVDAGGDVYVGGRNCEGNLWRIGIKDPRQPSRLIDVVEVTDMAVVTSGDYEQYYEIGGRRFSHIISPRTGYPQRDAASATVLAPSAQMADALATALAVSPSLILSELDFMWEEPIGGMVVVRRSGGRFEQRMNRRYRSLRDGSFPELGQ